VIHNREIGPAGFNLPIATTRVNQVRINDLSDFIPSSHLHTIFIWGDDEFKAPESVFRSPKVPTYRRTGRIAKEPEVRWEELIVHLL
jgi:hypothetical protein